MVPCLPTIRPLGSALRCAARLPARLAVTRKDEGGICRKLGPGGWSRHNSAMASNALVETVVVVTIVETLVVQSVNQLANASVVDSGCWNR